jgi:hypothetical protein
LAQESGSTKVTTDPELLEGKGSVTLEVVLAVSVSEVEVPGAVTLMVAVAVELAVRVPRVQVTTPALWVQVPWVAVAETNVTVPGSVSVILVLVALATPRFCTTTV